MTYALAIVTAIIAGNLFGFFVLGEFLCGWVFRMGTAIIKPGSRRGQARRE